jgi:uracil-DNA glycosylase
MTVMHGDEWLAAKQALEWQMALGADEALDEKPHDRFAEGRAEREARQKRPVAPLPSADTALSVLRTGPVHVSTEEAQQSASQLAAQCQTLSELEAVMHGFDGCGLKATATRLVFADGNPEARIMLVGEGPGGEEDREGVPFVGRAGKLLDLMLKAIHLDRNSIYIANIVPWRPPGNRTPTVQEIATCLPFIKRQIELSKAEFLVCLGATPTSALLNKKEGITRVRGQWSDYQAGPRMLKALATLHPAFLLRAPLNKRFAWRDWRDLQKAVNNGDS